MHLTEIISGEYSVAKYIYFLLIWGQVGDGTTSVVLLAGEFLREAKPFIEDGVHPQNLIRSYRTAADMVGFLIAFCIAFCL